ncbi:MAG: DinB family protein [Chloroflexi bacterium]|nr:DinB family protein [Chloroflexota bacterium]
MDAMLKMGIWEQFGAAIDMLDDAIRLCPDSLWTSVVWKDPDDARYGQYWYVAYHTVVWLDLYLFGASEGFAPPPPFVRGQLPEQPHTKEQVRTYLAQCRQKCQSTLEGLTDEKAQQICKFNWIETPYLILQIYSMRHVQEHAAQLNLLLGQHDVPELDWVATARSNAT